MRLSILCVVCASACAVSAKNDDALLTQSTGKLAEDDACADASMESDYTSLLQTFDIESMVQKQNGAMPSEGRTPGRHGPEESTSQAGAQDFNKVRRAKRRPVPPAARPVQRKQDSFDLFDLDGDGQLTRFEIDNVFQLNSPTGADDENSLLQAEEFSAASAIFDAFDLNGDGTVSREEYDQQQYDALDAQRRLEMDALRIGTDGGDDGGIDAANDAGELQYE